MTKLEKMKNELLKIQKEKEITINKENELKNKIMLEEERALRKIMQTENITFEELQELLINKKGETPL
ncbi:MAG: hypothetical protein RSD85_00060 [Erysipelotrichaceae bacterium]